MGESSTSTDNTFLNWIFGGMSYENDRVPASLTKVTVSKGSSIGGSAFDSCNNIMTIILPSTITSVGNYAFYNCTALKYVYYSEVLDPTEGEIYLPSVVTSIGEGAFEGCSKLTSINIPSKVKTIGNNAFKESGLASLTFEEIR